MTDTGAVWVINPLISGELLANHTYLLQSRMCRNMGYAKLAGHLMEEAQEEADHAARLIDRVLLLGGAPRMDRPAVEPGDTIPQMIARTIVLEKKAVDDYRKAAVTCLTLNDAVSMRMFQELADAEEGHLHWAETQQRHIEELGLQNFLTEWV